MKLTIRSCSACVKTVVDSGGRKIKNVKKAMVVFTREKAPAIFATVMGERMFMEHFDEDANVRMPRRAKSLDGTIWLRADAIASQVRAVGKKSKMGNREMWEVRYSEALLASWEKDK